MTTCKMPVILATLLAPAVTGADIRDEIAERGVSVSVGGGLVQFIDEDMRARVAGGAGWEGRIGFGTKTLLTFEAAYIGSLHAIDALGVDSSARLLGTGMEVDLRLNMFDGDIQPYVLTGLAWTRYSLVNGNSNTSDVANSDDIAALPMGLGVSLRRGPLTLDLRAIYRPVTAVDMFAGVSDGSLATWTGTLRAGLEY